MGKAWVISVDMGYGHQRAAYPFKSIAEERVITANNDRIISEGEQKKWRFARDFYETVSRMQSISMIGRWLFGFYNYVQKIPQLYPWRDLSRPTFQVYYIRHQIKGGLCKSIVDYIKKKDLPLITTFFITAAAADYHGLKKILCICTDSDINRAWVTAEPKRSNITYCAPCREVEQRLKEYGVPENRIFLTGFPLPSENLGKNNRILKHDLARRLPLLDPSKVFLSRMEGMVESYLGQKPAKPRRPLTILFAVGGAGAQADMLPDIMKSLKQKIRQGSIRLVISVGTNLELDNKYKQLAKELDIEIRCIHSLHLTGYFVEFNKALRVTDILWTKPSELSFYAGLGIPIICAPPIGHHEECNMKWLLSQGLAFQQEDPKYVNEWLMTWLADGRLAEAAFEGPIKVLLNGTQEITKLASTHFR